MNSYNGFLLLHFVLFQRTNLVELQESILTLADVLELKGDRKGLAEGVVLESRVDMGVGYVFLLLYCIV